MSRDITVSASEPVESKPQCPCPGTGVGSATQPPDGFDTGRSFLTALLNQLRGRELAARLNQLQGRELAARLNRLQGMNSSISFWEGRAPVKSADFVSG